MYSFCQAIYKPVELHHFPTGVRNLRPSQNNRSRGVVDQTIRDKIIAVVHRWVV